jgi:hypothetical protein
MQDLALLSYYFLDFTTTHSSDSRLIGLTITLFSAPDDRFEAEISILGSWRMPIGLTV